jgi:hypothetical protein
MGNGGKMRREYEETGGYKKISRLSAARVKALFYPTEIGG